MLLLLLRTAILSAIAVPTALLSAAVLLPAFALPEMGQSVLQQGSRWTAPAVPRQVLLIDLSPVLGPSLEAEALKQGEQPAPVLDDLATLNAVSEGESMSERLAPSAVATPWIASSSDEQEAVAERALQFQAQVRQPSPVPANGLRSQPLQQPRPALRTDNAPFPSLGQPQLDRQLRRYLTYLETIGRPDIVIVGGQGATQGVDPLALQASLSDRGYDDLNVFNWGLSNSSAQTTEWLLTELLTVQQLPKLVIWAEASPAFNGDLPDLAFARIQASPGQRLLAEGGRPQIAAAEQASARRLRQILSDPIQPDLPEAVVTLARSLPSQLQDTSVAQPSGQRSPAESARAKSNIKPDAGVNGKVNARSATGPTAIAQAPPVLIEPAVRVLPILRPQPPLPAAPAASAADGLLNRGNRRELGSSSANGFRLVNWCRNTNGPCQPADNQSPSALIQSAAPAWLRQTQAAQERLRRGASPSPQLPSSAAPLTARRSQASVAVPPLAPLVLPAWPQSQASRQFLQAVGFESVEQRLTPRSASRLGDRNTPRTFSLQGDPNRALHRLAQFSQQQDMAIAVVPLPLSRQSLSGERYRQEQSFRTYLKVAAQMTPLSLIELPGKAQVWQDELFAQPDHLNRYGAAVLAWQIGQSIDSQLLRHLQ